jgi:hypothetical protein
MQNKESECQVSTLPKRFGQAYYKPEVLSNLPPEIFWPGPRKGQVKRFSKLLPERVSFESSWSEALKLYTEVSKTDDKGWWPRRR